MDVFRFLGPDGTLDFSKVRLDPATAARVPAAFAMRRFILPLCEAGGTSFVAVADDPDEATTQTLADMLGPNIQFIRASREALRRTLLEIHGDRATTGRVAGSTSISGATASGADAVPLVENLMRAATLRHASDIHLDPDADGSLRVRFRVDGVLEDFPPVPPELHAAVASRVKVLSSLDIAEKRAPQDGSFSWRRTGRATSGPDSYDVRVATLPVRHGERLTLRLLETGGTPLALDALGMSAEHLAAFSKILDRPHGLVLLTGPTGSGKTTTLYAAIRHLVSSAPLNVLTVEDPVEAEIPGVGQCEVDSADKVSFGKALRSLLRHDPDVVMIGEIRDAESLDTAVKAALTGHLVLSTLHANDSVAAVVRLGDMGLAPHLVAATLRLSVAQRLARRLCPVCRIASTLLEQDAVRLGRPELSGTPAFAPSGCLACAGRGFSGRVGIFEFFEPDAKAVSAISSGASDDILRTIAKESGFRTLADDAFSKIAAGLVAPGDVDV